MNENRMNETKEVKRYFPNIETCYCCICMNMENAIKVSTSIIVVIHAMIAIFTRPGLSFLIFNLCMVGGGIAFIIGINKRKPSYTKYYKSLYLIKLIVETLFGGIAIYELFSVKDEAAEIAIETNNTNVQNEETIEKTANAMIYIMSFFIILLIGVDVYYYICACSFIEQMEEEILAEEKARNLENNSIRYN